MQVERQISRNRASVCVVRVINLAGNTQREFIRSEVIRCRQSGGSVVVILEQSNTLAKGEHEHREHQREPETSDSDEPGRCRASEPCSHAATVMPPQNETSV